MLLESELTLELKLLEIVLVQMLLLERLWAQNEKLGRLLAQIALSV